MKLFMTGVLCVFITSIHSQTCTGDACTSVQFYKNNQYPGGWLFQNNSDRKVTVGIRLYYGGCSSPSYFDIQPKSKIGWGMANQSFCEPYTAAYSSPAPVQPPKQQPAPPPPVQPPVVIINANTATPAGTTENLEGTYRLKNVKTNKYLMVKKVRGFDSLYIGDVADPASRLSQWVVEKNGDSDYVIKTYPENNDEDYVEFDDSTPAMPAATAPTNVPKDKYRKETDDEETYINHYLYFQGSVKKILQVGFSKRLPDYTQWQVITNLGLNTQQSAINTNPYLPNYLAAVRKYRWHLVHVEGDVYRIKSIQGSIDYGQSLYLTLSSNQNEYNSSGSALCYIMLYPQLAGSLEGQWVLEPL